MKVKYTPGNPDGTIGKTYNVEIIGISWGKVPHLELPVTRLVKIKYENGKTEWVNGMKFYSNTQSKHLTLEHITY